MEECARIKKKKWTGQDNPGQKENVIGERKNSGWRTKGDKSDDAEKILKNDRIKE